MGSSQRVFAEIARPLAILAESVSSEVVARRTGRDEIQHACSDDSANELRRPELQHDAERHVPRDECAEAEGRVHMTARDRANALGHRRDGEAKGEGDAKLADLFAGQHC